MNQFQLLITECLLHTQHVDSAAVLVTKTATVRAISTGFQIRPEEVQMFRDAFKRLASAREQSFHFQKKTFSCVRADRLSIYCKCGGHGLILVKTAFLIIVATYNDEMSPSICVEAVEKLAEYLRKKGK